jgi:hypothetical protein
VKDGGLYVFINCPRCGEREQCVIAPGEAEDFSTA